MSAGERLQPDHALAWQAAWSGFGVARADPRLLAQVLACWAEPHRKYHSTEHLNACLRHFDSLRQEAQRPHEVLLALWFHDAIYALARSDNEQASADWAAQALRTAGAADDAAQRVHALILLTRHDAAPDSRDAEVLLDIDLAILGQSPRVFARYEDQVAEEFAAVPVQQRRLRRSAILQHFLDRPRIYHTALFHARFEAQARDNLARSIAALRTAA